MLAQSEYGLNRRANKMMESSGMSRDFFGGYSAGGSMGDLILAGANSPSPKGNLNVSSGTAGGGGHTRMKKTNSFFLGDLRKQGIDEEGGDEERGDNTTLAEEEGQPQPQAQPQSQSQSHSKRQQQQHHHHHHHHQKTKSQKTREQKRRKQAEIEQGEIEAFLKDREAELIVLVEGIDVMTSATLQARHSYTHSDIVFNHTFGQCVTKSKSKKNGKGGAVIDFSKFHDLVKCSFDSDAAPLMANIG